MKRSYYSKRKKSPRGGRVAILVVLSVLLIAAIATGVYFLVKTLSGSPNNGNGPNVTTSPGVSDSASASVSQEPTPTPAPTLSLDLAPSPIKGETDPDTLGFTTGIMVDGQEVESYQRPDPISFGTGEEYTTLQGIITFRGNNYRNAPSWGTADITDETLSLMLSKDTSRIARWGGSGWTGQPLVVTWPAELRQNMTSLYDKFRTKDGFTEVILCSLDGRIYFMDLETGEKSRDFIDIGAPTKGTASIDPRGYPIIYVGQGLQSDGDANNCNNMYFRAFSLIDGTKLMECGAPTADSFAYRYWQAYDSSPLIDAESDTLIWPGENGILYTCKLNTNYNAEAGTITMDSDPVKVKYRYTSPMNEEREASKGGRWGMEDSAVAWRNYLMFTDNAGILQCVDLNTMSLVYANDLTNDSDVTMIVQEDKVGQRVYLYAGCEYDDDVDNVEPGQGKCYAYKIDAMTGEILWSVPFTVDSSDPNVDGGILASPILGQEGTTLEGLVIYNVTKLVKGDSNTSELVAIDTETGDIVWTYDMGVAGWSCSSPVPVYSTTVNDEGKTVAYIVQCEIGGTIVLLRVDGSFENGCTEVDRLNVNTELGEESGNNFEATPAVYGNTIVVGSRSDHIFFITIE